MTRTRMMALLALLALLGGGIAIGWAQTRTQEIELRVAVRPTADGQIEAALVQDGRRLLPESRFLTAEQAASRDGRWRSSTPVAVPVPPPPAAAAPTGACASVDRGILNFGFFAFFEPVSFSAGADPASRGYREHRGYEADLLTALEAMERTGLAFNRIPIGEWTDIWLTPAMALAIDATGGGITIRDDRTMDADGNLRVAFTDGHIQFRQTLLVRAADAEEIRTHDDLTNAHTVGAVPETTGEERMLLLAGLIDGNGVLAAGTRIATPDGTLTADGTDAYVISASGGTDNVRNRTRLISGDAGMPNVAYLGSEEDPYVAALVAGEIDAFARGELGNATAVASSGGALAVTAFDPSVEYGGWTVATDDQSLLACLNARLNYLTNDRSITFSDWNADPGIFMQRAAAWNAAN